MKIAVKHFPSNCSFFSSKEDHIQLQKNVIYGQVPMLVISFVFGYKLSIKMANERKTGRALYRDTKC